MRDGCFEWDDAKASSNAAKHGVSFERARVVFDDAFGIDLHDDRADYGEPRFIRIGMVERIVLTVVYTERDDRIRIISARRATRHEQDAYFEQNSDRT